ncbi:hypothetical protein [Bradyrhizobium yuanmingense]|uniref:hypothetical protein n=1 Tax=Bradyrhizobium yuanmingense TaxID=108015 RepID=UPI0023B897E5|nr:hypothetical protein [Bradyrhizobium yuanmingense]MDF0495371.1 hypothetical protein [Bradyrhizobium yuanmingense]
MCDDEHLPKLSIPPDHPLAQRLYDLDGVRWMINDKLNEAVRTNHPDQHNLRQAFEMCNVEIKKVLDEYRREVGAPSHQRVGLTYDNGWPVVNGRSERRTRH